MKSLGVKEAYKLYEAESESPVGYKEYVAHIKECNKLLLSKVMDSDDVELPYRMGKIHVIKYDKIYSQDKKKWAVDFNKTRKEGFVVYFDQKYIYKWRWDKNRMIVKNKSKYKFTASRLAKRSVPKALQSKKDFFKLL